jgi:hypothetical protein
LACDRLTYSGVDASMWERVRGLIGQEYGIAVERDAGVASRRGFTVEWTYDAGKQMLEVRCTNKPLLLPCGTINKHIDDLAAQCRVEPREQRVHPQG